ncbi:efflux RND transporter periplasmic adaptor subunit [Thiomicrorhabdus sp. 6S3-12]|uniref:efflux RND transporter periplasmic adaptor subunit n=1 Tax=Thiomicrorhabdus sp. 6S3-12 TaxID=2819681 RepID=UPI001AACFCA3|nr:biotin/lipoyl-binding protein [Thiomicrorhabdus sp. 6S3-12]MBO1923266.1 biotin/lipoyl-binding protein [Thiomicrorhabdus sp. 6S3-12]
MNKLVKRLIPILLVGVAIALFIYMKNSKPQQPPVEVKEKVWMVNGVSVSLENLSAVQTLYGVVESNALVKASAPISAVVEKVAVLPGDEVKKGELLVALSSEDLRLPVDQARADVADARAQLKLQQLTIKANQKRLVHEQKVLSLKQEALQRAKTLLQKNLASQSVVDAAKEALVKQEYTVVGVQLAVEQSDSQMSQVQARLQKAQAALDQAKLNQQRGVVYAPFDGRIAEVNVSAGDRVNVGSLLVSFYALESMELKAKLPVSSLAQAEKALLSQQSLIAEYEIAGSPLQLNLLRLAGEASTSGVDAYFSMPDALHSKRPGELMEVYFKGRAMHQVAAVPYSAIYGNDRVYLIEDERLRSIKVELKGEVMRNGKLMALIGSAELQDGVKVLTTHLPNAINGLKVSEVSQ